MIIIIYLNGSKDRIFSGRWIRVIDYMIDHDIEKENAIRLKELIRTDAVTFTTEDYMRMKGYIK